MFKFSEQFRVKRFRSHYKAFYPCEMSTKCKDFLNSSLSKIDVSKTTLIINHNDFMRQSFLYLFMRKGFVDFKFMSAYSLLDIYLGNNEDLKSVLDVETDVLCLYLGYGEFENKRQVDIIIQVINNMLLANKIVWLYIKDSEQGCESKFPGLISFFKANNFNIVSNGGKQGGVRKLSDEI